MKIRRVEHVAIAVDSMQRSLGLMRDTFGLELEYQEQIGQTRLAMLPVGPSYIELPGGKERLRASLTGLGKTAPVRAGIC